MQQLISDGNLLGMDIIVDRSEHRDRQMNVSSERVEEYGKLTTRLKEFEPGWTAIGKDLEISKELNSISSDINTIYSAIKDLMNAVNNGEKRSEVYASFDDNIDAGKVHGTKAIEDLRAVYEKKALADKKETASSTLSIIVTFSIVFLFCMLVLLLIGLPIIHSVSKSIEYLEQQLKKTTLELNKTSTELSENAQGMASVSTETASSIQESVSAIAEMRSMLAQTAKTTTITTELAQNVHSQSTEGGKIMSELSQSMTTISDSNLRLKEIIKIINDISGKTNVINEIVFKTQLLSVNASIEAARAGQHGRGFSVVASEVASLAASSGKAAGEIRELLSTSSEQVSNIIEGTSHSVAKGADVSHKAVESFSSIAGMISKMLEKIEQIDEASKEQETGISETQSALNYMNEASASANALAQKNALLSRNLKKQADQLIQIGDAMKIIVAGQVDDNTSAKIASDELFETADRTPTNGNQLASNKEMALKQFLAKDSSRLS
jgi:methyl-accepting chemotaxis protein